MADENIEIKVQDKVSPSISTKLRTIASEARNADAAVKNLQTQLSAINVGGLSQLINASASATRQLQQGALAAQRLATEQQRTASAAAQAAAAQTRVATAATQGATAQANLATATQRTQTAQQQTANAAQRLATEQQRTAVQTANAAAANDRAALAALRLQQAQDRAANSTRNATSALGGYIRTAAGILGVTISANAILSSADAYVTLQNKLQNVTKSQEQVNTLTNELFELSNRTRAGIEETATAFTRFDRALAFMGKSQEDSLRMTETINKALIVSGATAQEASSALLQLSQGFNAGKLQGDEFRAVSENMPIVLDAVAKALKVPINRVKELSTEGKITSEVLFEAFKLIQDQVDATFNKTTPTIGQSLTVLRNNAIQFFGELNKATGFTAGLSRAILWLGENLKTVAVIVAGLGVALLVAFGAPLVGALAGATAAVKAFTLALASNPIGLIVVALSTAIAYLTLFRDEINLGIDDVTTLGDFFRATFEGIGQAVDDSTSSWSDSYAAFFQTNRTGWAGALENAAKVLDAIAGLLTGAATFAGRAMAEVVISVQNGIANAYNVVAGWIESVTNKAIEAANKLRAMVGKSAYELVQFERMGSAGQTEFESWGKLWAQSLEDGFNSQGGAMQNLLNGLFDRSQQIGAQRRAAGSAQLRGSGASQLAGATDANAAKAAERRALAMEKINTQLDNELARMFQLQPQREAQAKFDQIEESLIQKKIKLTSEEAEAIKAKIKAVQDATEVQRQFDAIYAEAVNPLKEYNASQEAANKLLQMGAITQEQHARAVTKASEAYANSQDPLRQYNRDLEQQLQLLQMLPKQREIEQQIMQVQNDLLAKGIVLNETELAQLREKLLLIQQVNAVSQQEASLLDASVNKRQQFIDQLKAIQNLRNNSGSGFNAGDQAEATNSMLQGMGIDTTNFQTQLNAQLAQYQTYVEQLKMLNEQRLISDQEYAAASMQLELQRQNLYLNSASSFFGNLAALQQSGNKKMAAVGKAAAIAQAMINTYQSATSAYSAMASIPYVGPALGAAAAAAAIAAGLANVQQIRSQNTGFRSGGFTGSMGVNEVAGVVHGQEFVMNASATNRIGVADLQALQTGAASVQRNDEQAMAASVGRGGNSEPAPAPVVNVPFSAVVVQSKEAALAGLKSSEGRAFILETIEQNGGTVAKIVGVK
ncbi:tail length tape measure protein [Stenotrophomonas phage vB_SmaS-DLP_1]|uniref:Tape measure protein n=1 Tax=Stenotrophomonas phage vB_SmaS-DLP_1 TaxID=1642588 RepID=A0A0M3MYS3_9CAUD|nr:tail length tape measure protein [Stenotrophomonas phage vB_SmaS-DLP_1]AKI28787.1 tape measure protein [Stenotrophomonas phage vB_SmaS-DLP_1]